MEKTIKITGRQLKTMLTGRVPVRFSFYKKDGTVREAVGTRYTEIIPTTAMPKGSRADSPKTVPYYDYTVEGWRSVSVDTEIYVENI